jgi:molybdate transport system substrate-binding protein
MKLWIALFLLFSMQTQAEEIRVLSGATVQMEYQPMGRLTQSLKSGYPADMVIVTAEVVENLLEEKTVLPGKGIARVGIGVAVHEKAPLPDISSVEAFKRTLLAAKSVVYIDPKVGTSGGYITEPVGRGEIELGIHQISEILPVKGVKLVGPLPAPLQKYTVYVAAASAKTGKKAAVDAFIAHLTGPEAKGRLEKAGYTAPE